MPERVYKNAEIKQSSSDGWRTPQWLFDQLDTEFQFQVDLCADEFNHKLPLYYSLKNDALSVLNHWVNGYGNVPYSNPKPFVIKAYQEAVTHDTTNVLLVKSDTSTVWWAEHALRASEIRFLVGRLRFADENNMEHYTAKWGNAILIFSNDAYKNHRPPRIGWWRYAKNEPPMWYWEYDQIPPM